MKRIPKYLNLMQKDMKRSSSISMSSMHVRNRSFLSRPWQVHGLRFGILIFALHSSSVNSQNVESGTTVLYVVLMYTLYEYVLYVRLPETGTVDESKE
jgi:hypothetical protein